jgi:phytoene dehydrogenase-like protein
MADRTLQVIIVGAGLAGLACAADLATAGAAVTVLEAADGVGGRMRTDRQDGFLLDRGFQVVNTAYPQLQRRAGLRALRLSPFTPGVLLHTSAGRAWLTDPTRQPGRLASPLRAGLVTPADLAALGVLSIRDMFLPARLIKHGRDQSTLAALAGAGISGRLIELFFRPFLSGVFLEDQLETSSRFFHLVWRSMLRGTLTLPRRGVAAVPEQLAAGLPPSTVQLETPVSGLTAGGVLLADRTERPADAVVVATGAAAAAALLPGLGVPPTRTVTTYYHVAPAPPLGDPALLVDTDRAVLHTCVLSQVSAGYAPRGQALISTSALGTGPAGGAAAVRDRLAALYQTDTGGWGHLATRTVEAALPAMPAPHPLSQPCRVAADGAGPAAARYVCGDHRATSSVQGALASGARAAREVLAGAS